MSNIKLKPCPFCGWHWTITATSKREQGWLGRVICDNCGAVKPAVLQYKKTQKAAERAAAIEWNRRANDEQ